MVLQQQYSH